MAEKTIALLVAAGKSERMGAELPKPYLSLGGEALLRRTVRAFLGQPGIDGVRVVIRREHHPLYRQAIEGLTLFPCVIGGNSRQESVRLGLESIAHRKPERVLVHDIARPMASPALIARVLAALGRQRAAIPGVGICDTVKRAANGMIGETVSRENLYTVQTPQGFHFDTLLAAHRRWQGEQLTDDAALMEKSGIPVALVEGDPGNVKITTQADMNTMQERLIMNMDTHTGMGYDVHRLIPGDSVRLCGVDIPFTHRLEGHSDADVGLHALVDAILGSIGAGDIGMHFPPTDPKWQGADSGHFLRHAHGLLTARGGDLVHLDVTLICERPKIAPYREQMVARVAQLLQMPPDRVSIKATTTEGLGFTGRGEGIAAQAVVTVRMPLKIVERGA